MSPHQWLAEELEAAGRAHHEAFIETDGADPEWPMWYAEHLREAVNSRLDRDLTKSELIYLLLAADRSLPVGDDWPRHYAEFILEHSG